MIECSILLIKFSKYSQRREQKVLKGEWQRWISCSFSLLLTLYRVFFTDPDCASDSIFEIIFMFSVTLMQLRGIQEKKMHLTWLRNTEEFQRYGLFTFRENVCLPCVFLTSFCVTNFSKNTRGGWMGNYLAKLFSLQKCDDAPWTFQF